MHDRKAQSEYRSASALRFDCMAVGPAGHNAQNTMVGGRKLTSYIDLPDNLKIENMTL